MDLRWYQKEACEAVWNCFRNNQGNPLIELPTGAGKSLCIAELCRAAVQDHAGQVIVLAHRKELLEQNYSKIVSLLPPSVKAGLFSAGLRRYSQAEPIIVAGIQSCYEKASWFGRRHLVIVDEAHLVPSDGNGMYQTFLTDLQRYNDRLRIVGLTATPFRTGEGALWGDDCLFTHVCYSAGLRRLIDEGFLCPITSKPTRHEYDTSGLKVKRGEFVERDLVSLFGDQSKVIASTQEIVEKTAGRRSILVFTTGVAHAELVQQSIEELTGERVGIVTGDTMALERATLLRQFANQELRWLVNIDVLTTGFDAPCIDALAILRATASPGLFAQICMDSETEILTSTGWKKHHQIENGEIVAGFDIEDGSVKWVQAANKVFRPLHPGERFVSVKSPHLDIRVTETHDLILKSRSKTTKRWRKQSAIEASLRKEMFQIPIAGIEHSEGMSLTDDEIRLVGWMMTDGYISKTTNALHIAQAAHRDTCAEIERVLISCGLKYSVREFTRSGDLAKYGPCRNYYVSKGMPRGTGKHLTGWAHLEKYFDKNLSPEFEKATPRQLWILIEALNLGDGSKRKNPEWTQHTLCITAGDNRKFADRLQSLCVRRGFRFNISIQKSNGYWGGTKDQYIMYISQRDRATIGGTVTRGKDRCRLTVEEASEREFVWCVSNSLGTLITRRNGKVAIIGNCGRGLRKHHSKTDCLVLDFGENIKRHGPLDDLNFGKQKKRGSSEFEGETPMKECPNCKSAVPVSRKECECGWMFPGRQLNHEEIADTESKILSEPESFEVVQVVWGRHSKREGTDSLRVDYQCRRDDGNIEERISEWVCIEHEGFARRKAEQWWKSHCLAPCPETIDEAIEYFDRSAVALPSAIVARKEGKFWRVTHQTLGTLPPEQDWIELEAVKELEEEEMPF